MMVVPVGVEVLIVASQGSVLVLFFEDENVLRLAVTEQLTPLILHAEVLA